ICALISLPLDWRVYAQSSGAVMQEISGSALDDVGKDSDGDGIPDEREVAIGTNPFNRDTDGDGFDDLFEDTYREFGFDPLAPTKDSDRDGLSDDFEAALGTSPTNPDTDGDGWSDFDEVLNKFFGFDPLVFSFD